MPPITGDSPRTQGPEPRITTISRLSVGSSQVIRLVRKGVYLKNQKQESITDYDSLVI